MVGADGGQVAGYVILCGQLGALGLEHDLEVDQAAGIALLCQQRCIACGSGRGLQAQLLRQPASAARASSTSFNAVNTVAW